MDATEFEVLSDEEMAALLELASAAGRRSSSEVPAERDPPARFVTVVEPEYVDYTEAIRVGLWKGRGPEWQVYARELPRLLAEGHEGKPALVTDDGRVEVMPNWPTGRRAERAGRGTLIAIQQRHPLGRKAPMIRPCPATSSTPDRPD